MNFQMNQFVGANIKGQVDKIITPSTFPVQIVSTSVHTFVPGDAVKISGTAGNGAILVEICAATDVPFGFVPYTTKKNSYIAGEALEVLAPGSVLYLESAAAITAGASLEFVPTGSLIQTNAGTYPICGIALDSAAAANDLIRCLVRSSISVVATISGGSVNGSPVGNSSASTGKFTTLQSTGNATLAGALNYAADAGSTDAYAITLAPAPTAYTEGMYIAFKAGTANTGACSINVNALGAKALKRGVSTDPGDNYIKVGSIVQAIYDGTNFQMIQPAAQ